MDRYRKRKIKKNLYKYGNVIAYVCIFAVASIITLTAVLNRTDKVMIVDDSQIAVTEKESIELRNKDTQKVASKDKRQKPTEVQKEQESGTKIKIIADTLNVRTDASQESEALGMADEGEIFQIISQVGDWIEIDYNGHNGFVKADFVEVE